MGQVITRSHLGHYTVQVGGDYHNFEILLQLSSFLLAAQYQNRQNLYKVGGTQSENLVKIFKDRTELGENIFLENISLVLFK